MFPFQGILLGFASTRKDRTGPLGYPACWGQEGAVKECVSPCQNCQLSDFFFFFQKMVPKSYKIAVGKLVGVSYGVENLCT